MELTEQKREESPISIPDWILTLIISAIPVVNFIVWIIWSVGKTTHPSKKSYAQASLILAGAAIIFLTLVGMAGFLLAWFSTPEKTL